MPRMNLDTNSSPQKNIPPMLDEDLDFDFKPITSGLGFHHQKTTEVKPYASDVNLPKMQSSSKKIISSPSPKMEQNTFFQGDLALFYGAPQVETVTREQAKTEKVYRQASNSQRVLAYVLDLGLILSFLSLVMMIMARLIHLDLVEAMQTYPHEMTPMLLVLFVGFYLLYFAIFEKTAASTFGKNILGLAVVQENHQSLGFARLVLRTCISLANFISLGFFSYFDLQNKMTGSKVIRND
jgi:uncharacterized RDD family membrane protein YckC